MSRYIVKGNAALFSEESFIYHLSCFSQLRFIFCIEMYQVLNYFGSGLSVYLRMWRVLQLADCIMYLIGRQQLNYFYKNGSYTDFIMVCGYDGANCVCIVANKYRCLFFFNYHHCVLLQSRFNMESLLPIYCKVFRNSSIAFTICATMLYLYE